MVILTDGQKSVILDDVAEIHNKKCNTASMLTEAASLEKRYRLAGGDLIIDGRETEFSLYLPAIVVVPVNVQHFLPFNAENSGARQAG